MMSETTAEKIWKLLYPYIADEDAVDDYSAEMATGLCEDVLPNVWSLVRQLEIEAENFERLEAEREGMELVPEGEAARLRSIIGEVIETLEKDGRFPNAVPALKQELNNDARDDVVEAVIKKLRDRSAVGQKRYGTTLMRKDFSAADWLVHLQEEVLDAANYIEVLLGRDLIDNPRR